VALLLSLLSPSILAKIPINLSSSFPTDDDKNAEPSSFLMKALYTVPEHREKLQMPMGKYTRVDPLPPFLEIALDPFLGPSITMIILEATLSCLKKCFLNL
jgi:hypothetical protein